MNIRNFIFIALLLLACGTTFAQNDMVILKDGSVIRGTVSEYIASDHVRIRTLEGNYLEFPASEVKKIGFKGEKAAFETREKGYYNATSIGLLMGTAEYGGLTAQPSLHLVQGIQFRGRMNAGLGTGLELIYNRAVLPVFGEFRYHLKKENFSPYVSANGGYNIRLGSGSNWWYGDDYREKGGIMGGVQVGLRNYSQHNLGWTLSMGYRYQQMRSSYSYYYVDQFVEPVPVLERTRMHRIELRFGVFFH